MSDIKVKSTKLFLKKYRQKINALHINRKLYKSTKHVKGSFIETYKESIVLTNTLCSSLCQQ